MNECVTHVRTVSAGPGLLLLGLEFQLLHLTVCSCGQVTNLCALAPSAKWGSIGVPTS